MGVAGPNLFSFDKPTCDLDLVAGEEFVSIVQGALPYSQSRRLVRLRTSATAKKLYFCGNPIALSPERRYLQGGWVRAPGNIWHGRYFNSADKKPMCFGYSMPAIRNTPEWTFAVQLLMLDKDGTGTRRKDGLALSMALKQWTFPPEAGYMSVFLVAFGPGGEAGDFWVVELSQAPEASSTPVTER